MTMVFKNLGLLEMLYFLDYKESYKRLLLDKLAELNSL